MLTRIWQHRYQGFLATCLVGVAAAILVMLLPERQQAFARFVLSPSVTQGAPADSLLDDQRIVTRVLQQIEIEPPNPIDPRALDPIDAFKRNFALRQTGQSDEFEVSYVGRSSDRALEGVTSWIEAARDLYGSGNPADLNATMSAADKTATQKAALTAAKAREQSLTASVNTLRSRVEAAQEQLARFERERSAADKKLAAARAAREQALQAQRRQVQESAGDQKALTEAFAARQLTRQRAEKKLQDLQTRLNAMDQRGDDPAENTASAQALADTRLLERQATAVQRELAQVTERSQVLARRLSETPEKITEVVSQPAPVAPAVTANRAVLAREKAILSELRVRFTDNHPDVRRQLAIIADLESPGQSQVSQAPTIGARSVTRSNPVYGRLQAEQVKTRVRADSLRERLGEIETSRRKAQAVLAAGNQSQAASRARQQTARTELEQQVAAAETALADARAQEDAASKALASGDSDSDSARQAATLPVVVEPTAAELADIQRQRQRLADQVLSRQASQQEAEQALALARQETAQLTQRLASQSASDPAAVTKLASAGLQLVQSPQVVPALSNPYRPQWLLAALLGSLVVGALVAFALGLRRTAFHDLNELERLTGMRALGAVPRFSSRNRLMRTLVSVIAFTLLILLYGLLYLAFIAMVEKGGAWWPIDWPATKSALVALGQNVINELELDTSWLNFGSNAR